MLFCTLTWLLFAQNTPLDSYQTQLQPLVIAGTNDVLPLTAIDQVECLGEHLFLKSLRDTTVAELNTRGHLQGFIGRDGSGPGEWGKTGITAIALYQDELWGYRADGRVLNGFRHGQPVWSFQVNALTPGHTGATSNTFGVSDQHIVLPSPFKTPYLAVVYDKTGHLVTTVGEVIENSREMLAKMPVINDTMWLYHGENWYALFKFFPMINVYNQKFELIDQIRVESPQLARTFENIMTAEGPFEAPPLFSDFKARGRYLYAMGGGLLYQIDCRSGNTESQTSFFGSGPGFGELAGKKLSLPFFTFTEAGKLVLAHPLMLWNHSLWTANPPFALN